MLGLLNLRREVIWETQPSNGQLFVHRLNCEERKGEVFFFFFFFLLTGLLRKNNDYNSVVIVTIAMSIKTMADTFEHIPDSGPSCLHASCHLIVDNFVA